MCSTAICAEILTMAKDLKPGQMQLSCNSSIVANNPTATAAGRYSERQSSQQTDKIRKARCSSSGTLEHLTPRRDAFLPRCSTRLAACLTCAGCLLQLCWSPGASVVEEAVLQRSNSVSAAEAARHRCWW